MSSIAPLNAPALMRGLWVRLNRPPKIAGSGHALPFRTDGLPYIAAVLIPFMIWCMGHLDPLVQRAARSGLQGLETTFQYLTEIGRSGWTLWPLGLFIVMALWRWARGPREWAERVLMALVLRAWFVFFCVAGAGLTGSLIKNMIGRARPPLMEAEGPLSFHPFAFRAIHASFPSGHAITAMATAMALWLLIPKYRMVWLIIGLTGAFSRIIVNAHYLTDIMVGSLWGVVFTWLTWQAFARRALVFAPQTGKAVPMPWKRVKQALGALVSRWR